MHGVETFVRVERSTLANSMYLSTHPFAEPVMEFSQARTGCTFVCFAMAAIGRLGAAGLDFFCLLLLFDVNKLQIIVAKFVFCKMQKVHVRLHI